MLKRERIILIMVSQTLKELRASQQIEFTSILSFSSSDEVSQSTSDHLRIKEAGVQHASSERARSIGNRQQWDKRS